MTALKYFRKIMSWNFSRHGRDYGMCVQSEKANTVTKILSSYLSGSVPKYPYHTAQLLSGQQLETSTVARLELLRLFTLRSNGMNYICKWSSRSITTDTILYKVLYQVMRTELEWVTILLCIQEIQGSILSMKACYSENCHCFIQSLQVHARTTSTLFILRGAKVYNSTSTMGGSPDPPEACMI
jgi:hypothetical protein